MSSPALAPKLTQQAWLNQNELLRQHHAAEPCGHKNAECDPDTLFNHVDFQSVTMRAAWEPLTAIMGTSYGN